MKKKKSFEVSEEQLQKAMKILGTDQVIIFAKNPASGDDILDASVFLRNISGLDILTFAERLVATVEEEDPGAVMKFKLMNGLKQLADKMNNELESRKKASKKKKK